MRSYPSRRHHYAWSLAAVHGRHTHTSSFFSIVLYWHSSIAFSRHARPASSDDATFECSRIDQEANNAADTNCLRQYSPGECRHVGRVCGSENISKLRKCHWRGNEYHEGERFAPSSDPCFTCHCDANFDNSTSIMGNVNSCFPRQCGLELLHSEQFHRGCAPVYMTEDACCPTDEWLCRMYSAIEIVIVAIKVMVNGWGLLFVRYSINAANGDQ